MPFPVIDRNRYWAYAGGITSLLVHKLLPSFSTLTTTTSLQPTSDTAHLEACSPFWLVTFLQMLTLHIANKC
jgi:hypothetical protein